MKFNNEFNERLEVKFVIGGERVRLLDVLDCSITSQSVS